jgi:hypothetical protein
MKRNVYRYLGLFLISILMLVSNANAQSGDPPPPPSEHGNSNNQPAGGGAPIGEGLMILSMLGFAYAGRKWYLRRKQALAE